MITLLNSRIVGLCTSISKNGEKDHGKKRPEVDVQTDVEFERPAHGNGGLDSEQRVQVNGKEIANDAAELAGAGPQDVREDLVESNVQGEIYGR